jgi:putative transposase
VLEVSSSGYFAWRNRPLSMKAQADIAIGDALEVCFERSRQTYGRPRLAADLEDAGIRTSQKRLARLVRERNIHGASRRRGSRRRSEIATRALLPISSIGNL